MAKKTLSTPSKAPSKKIVQVRQRTGINHVINLDPTSEKAFKFIQEHLSTPNDTLFSISAIVRRALSVYELKIKTIKKQDEQLKNEVGEVRYRAAGIVRSEQPSCEEGLFCEGEEKGAITR